MVRTRLVSKCNEIKNKLAIEICYVDCPVKINIVHFQGQWHRDEQNENEQEEK